MRNVLAGGLLALVLATGGFAQSVNQLPTVKISVPDTVGLGELVIATAEIDKTAPPANLQILNFQWVVIADNKQKLDVLTWPDNSKLVFAAGNTPKTYTIILDVDCLYGKVDDQRRLENPDLKSPDIIVKTVLVGGTTPPPPDPGPSPQPEPEPKPQPVAVGKVDVFYIYKPETESPALADIRARLATRNWNGDNFTAINYSQISSIYHKDGKPVFIIRYYDGKEWNFTESVVVTTFRDVIDAVNKLKGIQ